MTGSQKYGPNLRQMALVWAACTRRRAGARASAWGGAGGECAAHRDS